jgi:hypothetical protein
MSNFTPVDETKMAIAALTACLVKTIGQQDESFEARFKENLSRIYKEIRENGPSHNGVLEPLSWTADYLRKL